MKPELFVDGLDSIGPDHKLWACPACARTGTLNRHGSREGCLDGALRPVARRYWCSPRRKSRPGCGKSFSVRLAGRAAGTTVSCGRLWGFLRRWMGGAAASAAWEQARPGFSLESAYRWIRALGERQARLRELLSRQRAPPAAGRSGAGALRGLLGHLAGCFETGSPIEDFQLAFQEGWLAPPPEAGRSS